MSQPLWAPWRMEYVLSKKQKDSCVFCLEDAVPDASLEERLVVWSGPAGVVMLNRYPFAAGHLLVIPRAHISDLEQLEPAAHDALFRLLREVVVRLKRAVRCEGVNVGINLGAAAGAGIAEHLHVHVVPRWSGDTNFMPVVAETRVIPQALTETRRHLATFFADLNPDE
ncbi:MAG: HIT domain-containing protein [Polyangiaceae bacterium]|jgi:ATP adenylyltransferase|nr:HIT domain-containing protein [Polyangiaceae bacterium]MBK8937202.1 HIT domain-containing protein [Polyangiaceae bacterium]